MLGDRSVLYKYVNPNLIVLLATENTTSTAGVLVQLVDAVSGAVLYTNRHAHYALPTVANAPKSMVVHCENWVVVSCGAHAIV